MIFKECSSEWIHLLEANWLYMYTTIVFIAHSSECTSFSVIFSEGIISTNAPDKSAWDVESNSYRFKNGALGQVMENSLHWILRCGSVKLGPRE